jgi:hypothetical protein
MCKYADKRRSRAVWSSGRLILMLLRTSLGVESAPYFLFTTDTGRSLLRLCFSPAYVSAYQYYPLQ